MKPKDEDGYLYYLEQQKRREEMRDELIEQMREKELAKLSEKQKKRDLDRETTDRLRRQQEEYQEELLARKRDQILSTKKEMEKMKDLDEQRKVSLYKIELGKRKNN